MDEKLSDAFEELFTEGEGDDGPRALCEPPNDAPNAPLPQREVTSVLEEELLRAFLTFFMLKLCCKFSAFYCWHNEQTKRNSSLTL